MTVLDPISSRDLLEVVEDRFGYRSTIISGQQKQINLAKLKTLHEVTESGRIRGASKTKK